TYQATTDPHWVDWSIVVTKPSDSTVLYGAVILTGDSAIAGHAIRLVDAALRPSSRTVRTIRWRAAST
ncbi:MAG: hypothetical protein ACM3JP_01335, partial [Betaproteobacteria bacterium]